MAVLFLLPSRQPFDPVAAVLSVGVMFVAIRVTFETPFGFTVASQLAFVPMLFCIPVAFVPLVVAGVLFCNMLPAVISGQAPKMRLLRCMANSWFSVGPALVFAIADVRPGAAGPFVLLAALAAQFVTDWVAASSYFALARGVSLRSQLSGSWVYLIDACLSGVGLVVAEELHEAPVRRAGGGPAAGPAADVRPRAPRASRASCWSSTRPIAGPRCCSGTSSPPTTTTPASTPRASSGWRWPSATRSASMPSAGATSSSARMLHDVGKITIPKEIINKPGKLDPHEWEMIKTHPAEGERMLKRVGGFMVEVGEIVRAHHERWDGGGYPDGLAGEAIPLEARIITCCDSWSAMRTDRPYRGAHVLRGGRRAEIVNAGTQFDPTVVEAMLPVVAASESPTAASDAAEAQTVTASADELSSAAAQLAVPAAS